MTRSSVQRTAGQYPPNNTFGYRDLQVFIRRSLSQHLHRSWWAPIIASYNVLDITRCKSGADVHQTGQSMLQLTVLGAGDSQGVPRWYCPCAICVEARLTGQNRRSRPSILLNWYEHSILFDAPPEIRIQLDRNGIRRLDAACFTHAHHDHIAGLVDLYDYARYTRQPLPIYIPQASSAALTERFPFLVDRVKLFPWHIVAEPFHLFGLQITPFLVPHGRNGTAHGFRIETGEVSVAYVPDALDIPLEVQEHHLRDLNLLILGTSFYHEEAPKERRSIYDVVEALALTARLQPQKIIFTHLSHDIDIRRSLPPHHSFAVDDHTFLITPEHAEKQR